MKSGDILKGLADYHASRKDGDKPRTWGDTATDVINPVRYGGASLLSGLGKTAEAAGYDWTGKTLDSAGRMIAPSNYVPHTSQFDWKSPSTYRHIPGALAESAPGLAVDLAGGVAGGAVGGIPGMIAGTTAAHAAHSYGNALEDRMAGQGKKLSDATTGDQLAAGAGTAAEGAIGAVGLRGLPVGKIEAALAKAGLSPAIGGVTKGAGAQALAQIPGQMVGAAARDAVAGAAGDVAQQVGRTAGTDRGLSLDVNELANSAALGGATGGAIRGLKGATTDVYQSARMRGLMADPQSATRVADAVTGTQLDLTDPKQAGDAIKMVEGRLKDTIADNRSALKLKTDDVDTHVAVREGMRRLKAGHELTEEQLGDIQSRLDARGDAQDLRDAITDLHTLAQ
uniref:hypothetical protein n=1 Tax=Methylobacterium sp. B34 TaxID=95563 RepID=UPI0019552F91